MSNNEQSSAKLASLAGEIMNGREATPEEVRSLAASVLTQAEDKERYEPQTVFITHNFDKSTRAMGKAELTGEAVKLLSTGKYILSVGLLLGEKEKRNELIELSIIDSRNKQFPHQRK